jgi:hypothetical protein
MTTDHHFLREDRTAHWQRIAAHLEVRPEDIVIALANIDRWLTLGRVHSAPLLDWRQRLFAARSSPSALRELITFLAAPNHDSEPLPSRNLGIRMVPS